MKIKKFLSIILSFAIILTTVAIMPFKGDAGVKSEFVASYFGTYDGTTPMEFKISSYDIENGTFVGYLYIDDSLVKIDRYVSGRAYFYGLYYECHIEFDYRWIFTTYDAAFNLRIDPYTGTVTGDGGGGMLFFSDTINLKGTVDKFYNSSFSYNKNDMKMCMAL
jgi:hypothetical protein